MTRMIYGIIKQRLFLLFVVSILVIQNGCLRTYYPALYHTSSPPIITETNNIKETSNKYLGADYTIAEGSYDNEQVQLMKVNFLIANTQDHTNINLEGFGYYGGYKVSGLDAIYNGDKSLLGVGGDFKFSANFKFNKVKIGMGINIGVGLEFGEYYQFRKDAGNLHIIDDENNLIFLLFSGSPMISYEFTEATILSFQVNAGIPGVISPLLVFNHNSISYWICWLPSDNIYKNNYGQRISFGIMVGLNNIIL